MHAVRLGGGFGDEAHSPLTPAFSHGGERVGGAMRWRGYEYECLYLPSPHPSLQRRDNDKLQLPKTATLDFRLLMSGMTEGEGALTLPSPRGRG